MAMEKQPHIFVRAAKFKGRFSRSEYWRILISTTLLGFLCSLGLAVASNSRSDSNIALLGLSLLLWAATLPIGLGAAVQRLHERSGGDPGSIGVLNRDGARA